MDLKEHHEHFVKMALEAMDADPFWFQTEGWGPHRNALADRFRDRLAQAVGALSMEAEVQGREAEQKDVVSYLERCRGVLRDAGHSEESTRVRLVKVEIEAGAHRRYALDNPAND